MPGEFMFRSPVGEEAAAVAVGDIALILVGEAWSTGGFDVQEALIGCACSEPAVWPQSVADAICSWGMSNSSSYPCRSMRTLGAQAQCVGVVPQWSPCPAYSSK